MNKLSSDVHKLLNPTDNNQIMNLANKQANDMARKTPNLRHSQNYTSGGRLQQLKPIETYKKSLPRKAILPSGGSTENMITDTAKTQHSKEVNDQLKQFLDPSLLKHVGLVDESPVKKEPIVVMKDRHPSIESKGSQKSIVSKKSAETLAKKRTVKRTTSGKLKKRHATPFIIGASSPLDIDLIDTQVHRQAMHARNNSSFQLQRAQLSPDGIQAASEIFDRMLNDQRQCPEQYKSFDSKKDRVSVAARISAGTNYYRQRMADHYQQHNKGLKEKYAYQSVDEYANSKLHGHAKPWGVNFDPFTQGTISVHDHSSQGKVVSNSDQALLAAAAVRKVPEISIKKKDHKPMARQDKTTIITDRTTPIASFRQDKDFNLDTKLQEGRVSRDRRDIQIKPLKSALISRHPSQVKSRVQGRLNVDLVNGHNQSNLLNDFVFQKIPQTQPSKKKKQDSKNDTITAQTDACIKEMKKLKKLVKTQEKQKKRDMSNQRLIFEQTGLLPGEHAMVQHGSGKILPPLLKAVQTQPNKNIVKAKKDLLNVMQNQLLHNHPTDMKQNSSLGNLNAQASHAKIRSTHKHKRIDAVQQEFSRTKENVKMYGGQPSMNIDLSQRRREAKKKFNLPLQGVERHSSQPSIQTKRSEFLTEKELQRHLVDPSPTFGLNGTPNKLLPEIQKAKQEADNDYYRHSAMDQLDRVIGAQKESRSKQRAQTDLSSYSKKVSIESRGSSRASFHPKRQPGNSRSPFRDDTSFGGRISPAKINNQDIMQSSIPQSSRKHTIETRGSDPDGIISGVSGILVQSKRENKSVHTHIMRVSSAVIRKAKREAEIAQQHGDGLRVYMPQQNNGQNASYISYNVSPHKSQRSMTSNDLCAKLKSMRCHESNAKSQISLTNQRQNYQVAKDKVEKQVRSFSASQIRKKMDKIHHNFQLDTDLKKFSHRLNIQENERKQYAFTVSAITGKHIPAAYRRIREKELDAKWESQRTALKALEWTETPLYQLYVIQANQNQEEGKNNKVMKTEHVIGAFGQQHGMFTALELDYETSHINKQLNNNLAINKNESPNRKARNQAKHFSKHFSTIDAEEEAHRRNMEALADTHFDKCMKTNKGLMTLLSLNFHFERLQVKFLGHKTIENTLLLMTRARKMYEAINSLLSIFRLIDQRKAFLKQEQSLLNKDEEDPQVQTELENARAKYKVLRRRLLVNIKTLLTEHTLFPVAFRFGDINLVGQLKAEIRQDNQRQSINEAFMKKLDATKSPKSITSPKNVKSPKSLK